MLNIPKAFTQGAVKAIIQAQISAASMGFERIGTGHLLVGLSKCADELTRCLIGDLSAKEVEEEVAHRYGRGEVGFARVNGLTPHAHRVVVRAIAHANPQKRTLAGTAHLWLELLYEDGCTAHEALKAMGKPVDGLMTALLNAVGPIDRPEKAREIPASGAPLVMAQGKSSDAQSADTQSALETYARNLTQAAAEHRLEPLIGREAEIEAMMRILGKKTKNNPILIGEPGVGKSAIVEGLAQRIADGRVPDALRGAQVYALDLAQMVAGSKYRGEFEERMKAVLSCALKERTAILFIDEVHTLIGAGGSEGSLDAANLLKPALARGEIRLIGATTHKEYHKYVEKDPALARRFQRIDVREPDRAQTLEILSGLRERYEAFHQVEITDEALLAAVEFSDRYVTDRFMPDKAIDLIDEASSMAKLGEPAAQMMAAGALPEPIAEAESGALMPTEPLPAEPMAHIVIGQQEVARIVSDWTGIPMELVRTSQEAQTLDLEARLNARVIGQEEAVSTIARAIRRARAGLSDPNRPLGVFMLLGPSGVGKTELCKALSEALFGREDALIRMDMSEYSEEASASRMIGSPPGYVGYGDGGQLTDAVMKRPYSVVLFDEIEKAHPKIFNLLLQLLDDGHLTDSVGRKVNFRNTIIVMTSNAGISFDMDKQVGFAKEADGQADARRSRMILAKAREMFRPEFLGRIDEMVVMHAISEDVGCRIAARMLGQIAGRLRARGVQLVIEPQVPGYLARLGVDATSGARNLRRVIQERVEDPLSDLLLSGGAGERIVAGVDHDEIVLRTCPALIESIG